MSEPTVREFERRIREIERMCADLREDYRWAYPWAYSRNRGGDSGKVTQGTVNDEVGNVAIAPDKNAVRAGMRHAAAMCSHALDDLRSGLGALQIRDRDPEQRPLEPSYLTRAERAESEAAKRRREAESRGWGEG